MRALLSLSGYDVGVVADRGGDAATFVASALIVRALRRAGLQHALFGGPCVIGIVGVSLGDAELITEAAGDVLKGPSKKAGGRYTTVNNCVVPRKRQITSVEGMIDDLRQGGRVCCLFEDEADIPAGFRSLCDGVATLPPVDATLIRAACLRFTGKLPLQRDLDALITLPLPLLDLAPRPGHSLAQAAALSRRVAAAHLAEAAAEEKSENATSKTECRAVPPGPKLEDLHGLGEVGEWGLSLARDMVDYKAGRIGWEDVDRGALVSGPPGTGKTTFGLALGRTCELPVFVHSLGSWQAAGHLDKLLKCMRAAFAEAKAAAPAILFIDELDSFGDRRDTEDHNSNYYREVINAFLECLDGAEARTGVVVVGATNYPHRIDPAIRRAGRLDRHLQIPAPDAAAREGILRYHLRGELAEHAHEFAVDNMEGMTGADMEQLVRTARRIARTEHRPLTVQDLRSSLPRAIPLSDELHRRICVHEAGHVVVGSALAKESGSVPISARVDHEVGNMQRNMTMFASIEGFDKTPGAILALATVTMAGMAAEEVILGTRGELSGGHAESDLARATLLLAKAEFQNGMGETLLTLEPMSAEGLTTRMRTDAAARQKIEEGLQACLDRARRIVEERCAEVEAMAYCLSADGKWSVSEMKDTAKRSSVAVNGKQAKR